MTTPNNFDKKSRIQQNFKDNLIIFDFIKKSFEKNISSVYKEIDILPDLLTEINFSNINDIKNKLNIPDFNEVINHLVRQINTYNINLSKKSFENPKEYDSYEPLSEFEVLVKLISKCLSDLKDEYDSKIDLLVNKDKSLHERSLEVRQNFLLVLLFVINKRNIPYHSLDNLESLKSDKMKLDKVILNLLDHNLEKNYFINTAHQVLSLNQSISSLKKLPLQDLLYPSLCAQKILNIINETKFTYLPSTISILTKLVDDGKDFFKTYSDVIKNTYPDHKSLFLTLMLKQSSLITEIFPSFQTDIKILPKPKFEDWMQEISSYSLKQENLFYHHKITINQQSPRILMSNNSKDIQAILFLNEYSLDDDRLPELDYFDTTFHSIMAKLKENGVLFSSDIMKNFKYNNNLLEITFTSKDSDIEVSNELISTLFQQIYHNLYVKNISTSEICNHVKNTEKLIKTTDQQAINIINNIKNKKF